jgi:hypothetical protein
MFILGAFANADTSLEKFNLFFEKFILVGKYGTKNKQSLINSISQI